MFSAGYYKEAAELRVGFRRGIRTRDGENVLMSRSRGFILIGVLGVIGLSGRAWAQPLSAITASPNPCVIPPGAATCTSYINWFTQEATTARVFVLGPHTGGIWETEFAGSLACESDRCPAPWIKRGNSYVFTLYDYSQGRRGRALASVTVTGERGRRPSRRNEYQGR